MAMSEMGSLAEGQLFSQYCMKRTFAPLFREWLDVHYPDRSGKVMSIVRSIRAKNGVGRDNDPDFFSRMQPKGVWADLLRSRFRIACKRAGIGKHWFELDCTRFRPPEVGGQMRLL